MGNSKSKKEKAAATAAPAAAAPAAQAPRPVVTAAATAASAGGGGGGGADEGDEVQGGGDPAEFKGEDAKGADGDSAYSFWDRNKTFKPQRQLPNNRQQQLQNTMKATMKATLGGGELQQTVKLPPGEDLNEWIAVNTVHFFNAASMIYGTCAEFCTEQSCATMSAGKAEYLWKDGNKYKKPTRVAAPLYIDLLLNWVDEQISNPSIFPVDENAKFPRNFKDQVKQIYKRLFRLYAHLYCEHMEKIRSIGANAHLNTCFKHFVYFVLEFNLLDKADMAPLEKLIAKFIDRDKEQKS